MDSGVYAERLTEVLNAHTQIALAHLIAIKNALPEKAEGLEFGVHPSQDPDGMFSVVVHLVGPDLYVLNKAIDGNRRLFDVRYEGQKVVPSVPVFDPNEVDFELNDVIVDTTVNWLRALWSEFGELKRAIPVTIFGEDGYGTLTPVKLN